MSHLSTYLRPLGLVSLIVLLLFLVVACGRSESSTSSSSPSAPGLSAAPTMPSGQFTAVGEQSVMTTTTTLTTTSSSTTATSETTAASADLSRGEAAYTKNKCGDCHGAAGEGVADKGKALTDMSLTADEFDNLLRTGGGLGNSHIFGRSAVSPSGMQALYLYVQSLK